MTGAYQVRGADQLERTLHQAGADLADLSATDKKAGDTLLAAMRPRTPVRTGRLVGSLFATVNPAGVTVGADAPYAGFVHAANPFLADAVTATMPTVLGYYQDAAAAACNEVTGA